MQINVGNDFFKSVKFWHNLSFSCCTGGHEKMVIPQKQKTALLVQNYTTGKLSLPLKFNNKNQKNCLQIRLFSKLNSTKYSLNFFFKLIFLLISVQCLQAPLITVPGIGRCSLTHTCYLSDNFRASQSRVLNVLYQNSQNIS